MLTTLAVIAALTYSPGAIPPIVGATEARDALLATTAPWPSGRAGPADRPELGRPWIGRTPVGSATPTSQATRGQPGAASYGASSAEIDRVIYARAGHAIVSIDPWTRIDGRGALGTLELARNQWLREQGYILSVRSHRNDRAADSVGDVSPRATIQLHDELGPRRSRLRVGAEPAGGPVTRVSLPPHFAQPGPARVVEPATAVADSAPKAQ
ncbi:MAG: hypothetical protein IBJ10_04800 [Phycisphaerales bacterium]|nr:hypothetical protein [Phycisphaerales bacterium]